MVAKHHSETSFYGNDGETFCVKVSLFALRGIMKYRVQNTRILPSEELLSILCKSAKLYSEYVDTTLLNKSITDYCSRPQKIMFILQRLDGETTYNNFFYEIKKDLFQTEKEFFADELKTLITI